MSSARNHQRRSHRSHNSGFAAMNSMACSAYIRGNAGMKRPSLFQRIGNVFTPQKKVPANKIKAEVCSNDGN